MLKIIAALVTVAAIVLAMRSYDNPRIGTPAQPRLATPDNSDYYMTDAVVHQMNSSGGLAYRMTLGQTLHFPDDSARLSDIDVHYISGTDTFWDVVAAKGRIPAGQRDIYLYDGVQGRQPRSGGSVIEVDTDNAWVRPDSDRIDTTAHVVAVEPGRRVEGDGMEVDLKTDKLRLLDNVQVTYTP